MTRWMYILLLFVSSFVAAQNEELFNKATKFYNEGAYAEAVESYLEIIENGEHSAALYYNLGNGYYKLNQIAPSIYYYEKALLLEPNDPEIMNNLAYAKNMTLDAIEPLPETGLAKIYDDLIGKLSFDQWALSAILFMILFVLAYLAFYYLSYSSHKRAAFITSICSLALTLFSLVFAFMQFSYFEKDAPAIVFAEEVIVKSEPNERSQQVFVLHEGTKVNVMEELNEWHKVQLVDGQIGWLPKEEIRLLKDF